MWMDMIFMGVPDLNRRGSTVMAGLEFVTAVVSGVWTVGVACGVSNWGTGVPMEDKVGDIRVPNSVPGVIEDKAG
jgi:hypothetical protein